MRNLCQYHKIKPLIVIYSNPSSHLSLAWLRAHLTAHTVPAAEGEGWIIFHLGPQEPAVILLPPEPPLPLAGLQSVLHLVEVGGVAVGIEEGAQAVVHPLLLLVECQFDSLTVHTEVEHLETRRPEPFSTLFSSRSVN